MTKYQPAYYVAFCQRFSYVRGLEAAYKRLAEYTGMTAEEVRQRRRTHSCAGLIMRVSALEARAAGL
jgi:hypothetical protein